MAQEQIICKKCGARNPPDSNFCLKCGSTLRKRAEGLETLFYLHSLGLSYVALSFLFTVALMDGPSIFIVLAATALLAYASKQSRASIVTRNLRMFSAAASILGLLAIFLMQVYSPNSLVFVGMVIFFASIMKAVRTRQEDKGLISPSE